MPLGGEGIYGNIPPQVDIARIIDVTDTEAFLIRKDGDGGDIFTVNTTNEIVTIDAQLIVDDTNTEALIVRKTSDGGDIFIVDTTNSQIEMIEAAVFSKSATFDAENTITYNSGTTTADWTTGNKAKMTFGAGDITTFAFTDPKPDGGTANLILQVKQDGNGNRTVTNWDADILWPGSTAPTLSTGANDIDIIAFYWDGTNYFGVISLDFS